MKVSAILLGSLIAVASASIFPRQDSSSIVATTTSASLSPQATCLAACPSGDVNCQAACVGTAHPNSAQANRTTECAAQCPQGDGSTADSEKFAACVQSCISSYFPTSQTVGAASGATGTVASNAASVTGTDTSTGTAAAATKTDGSSSSGTGSSGTSTAAGTAASASSSKGASANNVPPFVASAGGLAGLFMAMLAL